MDCSSTLTCEGETTAAPSPAPMADDSGWIQARGDNMTDSDTFNGMHPEHGAIHVLGGEVQDATSIYVVAARSMVQRRLLGSAHHQQYEEAYGHSFSLVEMAPEWREHFQLEYERARLEALDDPDAFTTDELSGFNLFGLIWPLGVCVQGIVLA